MNERIRELALQANVLESDHYDNELEIQKFAELIVRECCIALNPMLRDMVSRGQAYDLIQKHFGVEE